MGTLLVIDDSESVRREFIEILADERDFQQFLEASDGASGLKILTNGDNPVDVVACDLNMPRMDGFQFLRLVRANPALMNVPIVMVTSQSDVSEVVKAFELGANDFIVKPFNASILKVRLKNMLHIKHLQDLLRSQKEMMEAMATTDALTNIPNRRCFSQSLEDELHRSARYGESLSILLTDLDHFKVVNDTHGHSVGDSVLRQSAQIHRDVMRKVDLVARYGGEEFVVVMPHTDLEGARIAAERLRTTFAAFHFDGLEGPGVLTISIGVATYSGGREVGVQHLVNMADKALYQAKRKGRNRVEISGDCVK